MYIHVYNMECHDKRCSVDIDCSYTHTTRIVMDCNCSTKTNNEKIVWFYSSAFCFQKLQRRKQRDSIQGELMDTLGIGGL
jgi:hypothetical protein